MKCSAFSWNMPPSARSAPSVRALKAVSNRGRTWIWRSSRLQPLGFRRLGLLVEAFQESTLPFRVDVLDWHETSPSFQAIIAEQYAVIQAGEHIGAV